MEKKILSFFLIGLLFNLTCYSMALANFEIQDEIAEKIKLEVLKLGVGSHARIKVKLRDNTTVKGYVSESNDHYFIITNEQSKFTTRIKYTDIKQINNFPKNKGLKTIAAYGIVLTIVIVNIVATLKEEEH
jgi:hypothetical protein